MNPLALMVLLVLAVPPLIRIPSTQAVLYDDGLPVTGHQVALLSTNGARLALAQTTLPRVPCSNLFKLWHPTNGTYWITARSYVTTRGTNNFSLWSTNLTVNITNK